MMGTANAGLGQLGCGGPVDHRVWSRMDVRNQDTGPASNETPRFSGSRHENDRPNASRTLVEWAKLALGIGYQQRVRQLEISVSRMSGRMDGIEDAIDVLTGPHT